MSQVITFDDYLPPPRYDGNPWTNVLIEEGSASTGPWAAIGTVSISPVDPDPSQPDYRSFTTANASDTLELWYQLTFRDAAGAFAAPTYPVQNVEDDRPIYASVGELASLLNVRAADRHAALRRVLESAAQEIDDEIGTADITGAELPYGAPPALVSQVNLERAVEHWKQQSQPWGVVNMGDVGAIYTARDSWDRHAHKLSPLKASWGLA